MSTLLPPDAPTTRIGRPPKPTKRPVGRPPGEKKIMEDYRARLLASPSSRKVIEKVFHVALDDDHPHQAACMKMVMDRVLPVSGFSEVASGGQARPTVQITISGIGATGTTLGDISEGEYSEVEEEDTLQSSSPLPLSVGLGEEDKPLDPKDLGA